MAINNNNNKNDPSIPLHPFTPAGGGRETKDLRRCRLRIRVVYGRYTRVYTYITLVIFVCFLWPAELLTSREASAAAGPR